MTSMFIIGFVGAGLGCFVYDYAKLVRRALRRKRKLAAELNH